MSTALAKAAVSLTTGLEDPEKVTVATLVCDDLVDVEGDRFDPWNALTDHQPLGEIMRARKVAYYPSVMNRGAD